MRKLAIGVLAAAIVIAGCGGSSKNSVAAGGNTPTTGKASTSNTTAVGGGNDDFSQLVTKAKTADFKITYTGQDGKSETIAQDGHGKIAFTTDSSYIVSDGTKTISCNGTTASATCTDLGATGAGILSGLTSIFTSAYAGLAGLNSSVYAGHTSSETIAGRDATCITIKASDYAGALSGAASKLAGDASVTSCVDKQLGYLLKLATSANETTTQELVATAAGPSSPSDFNSPSTPQTLPSIPAG